MDSIHLLTTDTCKGCKAKFMSADKYDVSVCPSCVISALEQGTKYTWICNMDPPLERFESYLLVDPSKWFHVVMIDNNYLIVSKNTLSMRSDKFGKIHYSGNYENCMKWIKRQLKK